MAESESQAVNRLFGTLPTQAQWTQYTAQVANEMASLLETGLLTGREADFVRQMQAMNGINSDDATIGSAETPYIGYPSMQGAQNRAEEVRNAPENDGIMGKIQGFIGSAGLVIVGAGVLIVAFYFAAKQVGET